MPRRISSWFKDPGLFKKLPIARNIRDWFFGLLMTYLGLQLLCAGWLLLGYLSAPAWNETPIRSCLALQLLGTLVTGYFFVQSLAPTFPIFALTLSARRDSVRSSLCIGLLVIAFAALCSWYLFDHFMDPYPYIVLDDTTPYRYGLAPARYLTAFLLHSVVFSIAWNRMRKSAVNVQGPPGASTRLRWS